MIMPMDIFSKFKGYETQPYPNYRIDGSRELSLYRVMKQLEAEIEEDTKNAISSATIGEDGVLRVESVELLDKKEQLADIRASAVEIGQILEKHKLKEIKSLEERRAQLHQAVIDMPNVAWQILNKMRESALRQGTYQNKLPSELIQSMPGYLAKEVELRKNGELAAKDYAVVTADLERISELCGY